MVPDFSFVVISEWSDHSFRFYILRKLPARYRALGFNGASSHTGVPNRVNPIGEIKAFPMVPT